MSYILNTTDAYHRNELDGLGWELTVCNSLWPADSPCRRVLEGGGSYGAMLLRFLKMHIPPDKVNSVLEVGGGYGFLMHDFLEAVKDLRVTMLDISPFLLERQREILRGRNVSFVLGDFLARDTALPDHVDMVIMNENLGDLPTLLNLTIDDIGKHAAADPVLAEAGVLFKNYGLQLPPSEPFNLNLGALLAVEKICRAGVPYAFLSEHSCEAAATGALASMININAAGTPEKIRLRGHDEYTIKFSYLENVARRFGYRTLRGPVADYLPPLASNEVRFLLSSSAARRDEDEIIRQFLEDLYTYEYLLLVRG